MILGLLPPPRPVNARPADCDPAKCDGWHTASVDHDISDGCLVELIKLELHYGCPAEVRALERVLRSR